MNVEQRLQRALRVMDPVEPSPDLWSRVVHSIEEDRIHRRRVRRTILGVVAVSSVLLVVAALSLTDTPTGTKVDPATLELVETIALVCLVVTIGPAIRRFGRGYAHDLWCTTPGLPSSLLRLLDVAYALVFSGYILLTASLDVDRSAILVGEQLEGLGARVGGLLLTMGLLHATTIMALPLMALISNSTRVGRSLPRWVVGLLVLIGIAVGSAAVLIFTVGVGAAL